MSVSIVRVFKTPLSFPPSKTSLRASPFLFLIPLVESFSFLGRRSPAMLFGVSLDFLPFSPFFSFGHPPCQNPAISFFFCRPTSVRTRPAFLFSDFFFFVSPLPSSSFPPFPPFFFFPSRPSAVSGVPFFAASPLVVFSAGAQSMTLFPAPLSPTTSNYWFFCPAFFLFDMPVCSVAAR